MTDRLVVEANGASLGEQRFPGRQGRIVFAYLVAQRERPVPRDELAELLWGDELPATWEKALRVLMTKLRALLEECGIDGGTALSSAFGCYKLSLPAGAWIDVEAALDAVERAEVGLAGGDLEEAHSQGSAAAALARRCFLPGENGAWVEDKRRELREVLIRALECLADLSLAAGDVREAGRYSEELTLLEPYRESGYRRLMHAHVAAGDDGEALRVYERCRRLLAEELGAYPSAETESLYRDLLGAQRSGAASAASEADPAGGQEPDGAVVPAASPSARLGRRLVTAVGAGAVLLGAAIAVAVLTPEGTPQHRTAEPNSIAVIDPETMRVVTDIAVGTGPTAVAADDRGVWVANTAAHTVDRIDPGTGSVRQTVKVGSGPTGVVLGAGAVWVANGLSGDVSRIDPVTNEVVQTIQVGNSPTAVAFGEAAVWVPIADDRAVVELDPVGGRVVRRIPVDVAARGIAVAEGSVWLTDPVGGAVVRVDPRAGAVTSRVSVGSGATAVAFGEGAVWVANSLDGTVSRVDAARGIVVDTIPVGSAPNGIVVAGGAVWVTDEAAGTLIRIDPSSGAATRRLLGGRPRGIGYTAGSLWVAVQPGDVAHRGGTLRMLTEDYLDVPDPARSFGGAIWLRSLLSVTSDGLVGFKRVGGVEGNTIVPDLATALPVPTDGGRTYSFRLRVGLRFSNGGTVRASDVRFTLERIFKSSAPGLHHYTGLVGGRACQRSPAHCDLSRGVVVDDEAGTVTIHLREPDPEFLYKLALPLAFVVPSGTPSPGVRPVPGTGPYRLERYEPGPRIRLVRNPYFRFWSSAAQPRGIPDAIEWSSVADDHQAQVTAIEETRADVSDFSVTGGPDGLLDDLRMRYPARVHITPLPTMLLAQLNTTRPPFDSLAARRAVAFAVDRARIVELASGTVVQPSCQVLPPNFPGYRPYCPHTTRPGSSWTAPDLARARELVRRSGTTGMRVDMTTESSSLFASAGEVVADALRALGYRVSLKTYGDLASYFAAYASEAESAELALSGYVQDYPAPSEVIEGGYSCSPYFCDPSFSSRAQRLRASQTRDPQAALAQWARLDRELVERAVLIPLVNVKEAVLVSKRVGNYQRHPVFGPLVSQLWVR